MAVDAADQTHEGTFPPSLCAISVTFFLVGCASLAGDPSAFAERQLVAQRKWLTAPAFRSFRILSRVTPGLPPVNLAVAIGRRLHGVAGSLAAVSGMLAAPMAAALTAGLLYLLYGVHMPYASTMPDASTMFSTGNFLSGLASASAGLAFAAGARGFRRIGLTPGHALVVLFMAAAYAFGHLPFVLVVALAMPLSLIVALVKGHKVKPVDEANG